MGIPAYYSYLVKNYKEIIIKLDKLNKNCDNFYLDSNSIIYNCLANMKGKFSKEFVNDLIRNVCLKIDTYIKDVNPNNLVYISFDGVAPLAKLNNKKKEDLNQR